MNQACAIGIFVLISFMLLTNGALQQAFGAVWSLLIIHATGTVVLAVILLLRRTAFAGAGQVSPLLWSAGALGVLLVFLNNQTVGAIGLSLTIALGVVGQLVVSSIVDHFGLFGMTRRRADPRKLLGLTVMLTGVAVMASGPGFWA